MAKKLTDEVKRFIVERLASYDSPQTIADAVREEFGVTVDRRAVAQYDPERSLRPPSRALRAHFKLARQAYEAAVDKIPVGKKAVRLRRLEAAYHRAVERGNEVLVLEILEQAAKEMGDAFTNKRQVSLGDPLEELSAMLGIPAEEIRAALASGEDGEGADGGAQ